MSSPEARAWSLLCENKRGGAKEQSTGGQGGGRTPGVFGNLADELSLSALANDPVCKVARTAQAAWGWTEKETLLFISVHALRQCRDMRAEAAGRFRAQIDAAMMGGNAS